MRSRPTFSNVVSLLALVVALGGTSYAAVSLPAKSVGTQQLQGSAVTSAKVKNGSLLSKDFKVGQLVSGTPGPKGDTGPRGAAGPAGPTGLQGSDGAVRAYAAVRGDGTLDTATSKGVVSVTHVADSGVYCINVDPAIPVATNHSAVATLDVRGGDGTQGGAFPNGAIQVGNVCAGNSIGVLTRRFNSTSSGSSVATVTYDQAFFLLVP